MKTSRIQTRVSALLAVTLIAGVLLACSFTKNLLNKATMFEGTTAKDAAEAFKEKLGGPVRALSLELEPAMATLRAQDPKNLEHVNEYRYAKGIVIGPSPVQLNSLERNLKDTLFDLDEINLAATATLAQAAVQRVAVEGGKVSKMTIERGLSFANDATKSGTVRWNVEIKGTRENASATADTKGNILGVDLSQTARAANFTTYAADVLREAGPKIKEVFGGRVRLVEVVIYEKYLWFKALSPRDATEVTQYKYDLNGVTTSSLSNIGDQTPIRLRINRKLKLEDLVFDLDEIKLEMAPDLGEKALARLGFTGGQITHYKITRDSRTFGRNELVTAWEVSCKQGRKTGWVSYDLNGNELKVSKQ